MSIQLNNVAMYQYLLTVSKGSSFLRCDAVLLGVQLLTFQRTVVASSSASNSPRRIIAFSTSFLLSQKCVKQPISSTLKHRRIRHPMHQYQISIL